MPSPAEIAARIWDAEHGPAKAEKAVSHANVPATAAAAVPCPHSAQQLIRTDRRRAHHRQGHHRTGGLAHRRET
ncbi:hypothetical protein ACH4FX_22070 [Streptomyces sp. NPDC018019]|uniref:hypothetical protein n=1 Tax=Streptomyces sp. NPDC018019 TaxID=3365030 RepID=UPI003789CA63